MELLNSTEVKTVVAATVAVRRNQQVSLIGWTPEMVRVFKNEIRSKETASLRNFAGRKLAGNSDY